MEDLTGGVSYAPHPVSSEGLRTSLLVMRSTSGHLAPLLFDFLGLNDLKESSFDLPFLSLETSKLLSFFGEGYK